jgi:hypothetical protein
VLIIDPSDLKSIPVIVYERKSVLGKRNIAVLVLSLLCIGLFASSAFTKAIFGDIGIVSLCYIAIMFGSGMLTEVWSSLDAGPATVFDILCMQIGGLQLLILAHAVPPRGWQCLRQGSGVIGSARVHLQRHHPDTAARSSMALALVHHPLRTCGRYLRVPHSRLHRSHAHHRQTWCVATHP